MITSWAEKLPDIEDREGLHATAFQDTFMPYGQDRCSSITGYEVRSLVVQVLELFAALLQLFLKSKLVINVFYQCLSGR